MRGFVWLHIIYMPIMMKFGLEEYITGLHLHAKFGPGWGGGVQEPPNLKICYKIAVLGVFSLRFPLFTFSFSSPPFPSSPLPFHTSPFHVFSFPILPSPSLRLFNPFFLSLAFPSSLPNPHFSIVFPSLTFLISVFPLFLSPFPCLFFQYWGVVYACCRFCDN